MKYITYTTWLLVIIASFSFGCRKEKQEFSYAGAEGIWVPYEVKDSFGVSHGPFLFNSVFGSYAESVEIT